VSNRIVVLQNWCPYSASEIEGLSSAAKDSREEDLEEANRLASTFQLELLDHNLENFYENEREKFLFKHLVSERTKQSLKTLVHERYTRSKVSAFSWEEVNNTKERVREGLRAFFMKERGGFPPWLDYNPPEQ
jgi:hypothetical protein